MKSEQASEKDTAAMRRRARFGKLPDRIPYQDLIEEEATAPGAGSDNRYDPEGSWNRFSCLALDLAP
ncbi:hypothetical protein ACIREO_27000 [Streptomyces sp. NPDC102441]|uniref:hypothetical protein n=1 Tax=Streptomyces sp. NPDC102441 TaxID=3366176 RepID=UPI0038246198